MKTILPYLFWIDHVKARLKLVELVFAHCSWTQVFTLENSKDLIFRFNDLSPWAIVLDEKNLIFDNQELLQFFENNNPAIIHLAESGETLRLQKNSIARLSRLINPMELEEYIKQFYHPR